MMKSLSKAIHLDPTQVEILCSWNGSEEEEQSIINTSPYEFLIAERNAYHFAKNMNSLAQEAHGEFLLFINDDVIADDDCINKGIDCLINRSDIGIIGAKLREENGLVVHSGMLFDQKNSPYHKLELLMSNEDCESINSLEIMPAVTGAMMLTRRKEFLKILFQEKYKRCGEDVELCLDFQEKLNLKVAYAPEFSGIHSVSKTRKEKGQYGNDSEDLTKMRSRRRQFLETISREYLINELMAYKRESEQLSSLLHSQITDREVNTLTIKNEIDYWKNQAHTLQINRIRQSSEIEKLRNRLESYQ